MAVDRYATNAFFNYTQFENGVFAGKGVTPAGPNDVLAGDNPAFIWPSNNRRIAAGSPIATGTHNQKIQRGYMRMLSQGFSNSASLERKRLHFQFNPETITRAVSARNDIQAWMNQDPVQMTQAIPGDANFSFELFFNREHEVSSGSYRDGYGGPVRASNVKATLPSEKSQPLKASDVTDIGVLADLIVFDEIIGQGVNSQLIKSVIENVKKVNTQQRNNAASRSTSEPTNPAVLEATVSGGKITNVTVVKQGSGYVVAPKITFSDSEGSGATATVKYSNGNVTEVVVTKQGSGYVSPKVIISGGGSGSGKTTSDSQDQVPISFDSRKATSAANANFGNSAFLVSLPVRIVFSSLFMVEGYITATTVTFNKFNPNMVPTQCVVGVTMQALYIGFAREKTYLTTTLASALNTTVTDTTGGLDPDTILDKTGLTALGSKLYKDKKETDDGPGGKGGWFKTYNSKLSPKEYLSGDYTFSWSMGFAGTDELKAELKKGTIAVLAQHATLTFTYKGNSSGPPQGSFPVDAKWILNCRTEVSKNGIKGDKDSVTHTFKLLGSTPEETKKKIYGKPLTGQTFDTSNTSLWDVDLTIKTKIKSTYGNTVTANQLFIAKTDKPIKWDSDDSFTGLKNGYFQPEAN